MPQPDPSFWAQLGNYLWSVPWKDVAPWMGIAASLGFNVINYRRGTSDKRNAHRLGELKSLRTPVEAVFDEIGDQLFKVGAIEVAKFDKDISLEIIKSANKQLAELYIKAQDRLSRLDVSTHFLRNDFLVVFEGKWDTVTEKLDALYNMTDDEVAFKRGVKAVPERWRVVRGELSGLIDDEIAKAAG